MTFFVDEEGQSRMQKVQITQKLIGVFNYRAPRFATFYIKNRKMRCDFYIERAEFGDYYRVRASVNYSFSKAIGTIPRPCQQSDWDRLFEQTKVAFGTIKFPDDADFEFSAEKIR